MELAPLGLEVDASDYARVTGDCVTGVASGAAARRGVECGLIGARIADPPHFEDQRKTGPK